MYGLENVRQFLSLIFKSFFDFHMTIEDIISEGDKVWIRVTLTGTYTGEYLGLTPTDKKFTELSVWIYRIVDGKVVEGWDVDDVLDFYKQLDLIDHKGFPDETS